MENNETQGAVYYMPPIRNFQDTGFVTHGFADGSSITTRVLPSKDSGGFMIELVVKSDSEHEVCRFTMDRFAALCMVNALTKNLMDQEELVENEYNNKNQFIISRLRDGGRTNQEGGTMG